LCWGLLPCWIHQGLYSSAVSSMLGSTSHGCHICYLLTIVWCSLRLTPEGQVD
jgi:hypothetical protein